MDVGLMPRDVLIGIFECIAQGLWEPDHEKMLQQTLSIPIKFPWVDMRTIIAVSHVCKNWRDAILETSTCWSTIVIEFNKESDKDGQKEVEKIRSLLSRARNKPITVILINEYPTVVNFSSEFIGMVVTIMREATNVYARFMNQTVMELILSQLVSVPLLEHLALWIMRWFDFKILEKVRGDGVDPHNEYLPGVFLRNAPRLRTIHTRGVPLPNFHNQSLSLPSIEEFTFEDDLLSLKPLQDYTHFLSTFKNITSLTLLPKPVSGGLPIGSPVTFNHLEYLEMSIGILGTHSTIGSIVAPKLRTAAYPAQGMEIGPEHRSLAILATLLRKSSAPYKRFILKGFAFRSRIESIPNEHIPSHIRCFQILATFSFVDVFEFHRCVFKFTSAWNMAWITGVQRRWESIFLDGIYSEGEDEEELDPEETYNRKVDVSPILCAYSSASESALNQGLSARNPPPPPALFMLQISQMGFMECSFTDLRGAREFADVLILRQKLLKASTGRGGLRAITFDKMEGEVEKDFVDRLRGSKNMERVVVQVSFGR